MLAPEMESDQDLSLTHQLLKTGDKISKRLDLDRNRSLFCKSLHNKNTWSSIRRRPRRPVLSNSLLLSWPGIHAPLGPRTARCELVRYFSVFIGPGAVRSEFFKNCSVLVRCGPKFRIFENFVVLVRCGPEFLNTWFRSDLAREFLVLVRRGPIISFFGPGAVRS